MQGDYQRGDFLADTAPSPNMYFVANASTGSAALSYNLGTCQAGSSFPKDCASASFQCVTNSDCLTVSGRDWGTPLYCPCSALQYLRLQPTTCCRAASSVSESYMTYTPDVCQNKFSPGQVARMRCFVDR